ncbi:MAG: hypothetical protein WBC18_14660 [Ottowia sp.]
MNDIALFCRLTRMRRNVGLLRAMRWAAHLVWRESQIARRLGL